MEMRTYRLFLIWSLAFHLYSTPLCLNLRELEERLGSLSGHPETGSHDIRARLVYDPTVFPDGHL